MTHQLKTRLTTVELEARDTETDPLIFGTVAERTESYEQDSNVILTSADGDVFIGHVEDIFDSGLKFTVVLD